MPLHASGYTLLVLVQHFYDLIYSDDKAVRRYHAVMNQDESIQVTSWCQGKRDVTFTMDVAVPATLRRFLGELATWPTSSMWHKMCLICSNCTTILADHYLPLS